MTIGDGLMHKKMFKFLVLSKKKKVRDKMKNSLKITIYNFMISLLT